jgi:uncharacterized membrane protein YoaK (UPF0700 family)
MEYWILLTILLGLIAVIVGISVLYIMQKKKKEGTYKEPDYRAFFIMGICFLPMGIIFTSSINPGFIGFIGLGIVYMAIGLANRDKWKKED